MPAAFAATWLAANGLFLAIEKPISLMNGGRLAGCYVHGLFADDRQRREWLTRIGAAASDLSYEAGVEATLDALADHLEKHIDCSALLALARPVKN